MSREEGQRRETEGRRSGTFVRVISLYHFVLIKSFKQIIEGLDEIYQLTGEREDFVHRMKGNNSIRRDEEDILRYLS